MGCRSLREQEGEVGRRGSLARRARREEEEVDDKDPGSEGERRDPTKIARDDVESTEVEVDVEAGVGVADLLGAVPILSPPPTSTALELLLSSLLPGESVARCRREKGPDTTSRPARLDRALSRKQLCTRECLEGRVSMVRPERGIRPRSRRRGRRGRSWEPCLGRSWRVS